MFKSHYVLLGFLGESRSSDPVGLSCSSGPSWPLAWNFSFGRVGDKKMLIQYNFEASVQLVDAGNKMILYGFCMILYGVSFDFIWFSYDFIWFLYDFICFSYDFICFSYDFIWFLYDFICFSYDFWRCDLNFRMTRFF